MNAPTTPPISEAQNTERGQRFLRAQSRLYTEAKQIHDLRLALVSIAALVTAVVAVCMPDARAVVGAIGGIGLFAYSWLASEREKRRRREAASVQEEFDTFVFQLPWNDFAADHVSPTLIAEAAARYRGDRTRDWYPDTAPVIRPLDVLICQRSNLGWGASIHRLWAALLSGILAALVLCVLLAAWLLDLNLAATITALVLPMLGPVRELGEMIQANRVSADTKRQAETKVLSLWNRSMTDDYAATEKDCRAVQDKILAIRQANAHIPDRLDQLRRPQSEAAMQLSAQHLIEEATAHGQVSPNSE
ncbi:hypothetical protein EEB14_22350 [Rhodococcus sp. WS4]|nr:hypothetical protein EEB14_22350 [Rhodococcus sp. WS4]